MKTPRILIVDDEEAIRALGQSALKERGFETDTACNGLEGWRALQSGNYQLVVTDHQMPGLTGLGLIQRLRDAKIPIPIVMASATLPTEGINATSSGTTGLLQKPFTARQLVEEVERALSTARRSQEV